MHNTLYVPGHFHATVVAGTTLAFMAITYLLVPLIFQREIIWPTLAKWQPYLFGIGRRRHLPVHDGRRDPGCLAPSLGHHLQPMRSLSFDYPPWPS